MRKQLCADISAQNTSTSKTKLSKIENFHVSSCRLPHTFEMKISTRKFFVSIFFCLKHISGERNLRPSLTYKMFLKKMKKCFGTITWFAFFFFFHFCNHINRKRRFRLCYKGKEKKNLHYFEKLFFFFFCGRPGNHWILQCTIMVQETTTSNSVSQ